MVATGGPHQLSDWSVDGDRIAGRLHATEMETSGIVSNEAPAQIHLGLSGILVLIETFRRRMPNIDLGPSDGTALPIGDFGMHGEPRPGVGERTNVSPLALSGWSSRQNGPSMLACVSVWPSLPLLSRQTNADTPSEPAINTASLCEAVVFWPNATMILVAS